MHKAFPEIYIDVVTSDDKGVLKNEIYKLLKIHKSPVKYVSDKYRYQSNIDGRGGGGEFLTLKILYTCTQL